MRVTASSASSHCSRLVSRSTPKPPSSASEEASPVPNSTRPSETRSSVAMRSATRAGWLKRWGQLDDAVAEADVLGALAGGGEEDLRRRGVGVLLEEVVLDLPDVVEAELVGELDLLERVLEQAVLVVGCHGPRKLVFVEDAELHGSLRAPSAWSRFRRRRG